MAFAPDATIAHQNLKSLRAYLRHQYEHGRGLSRFLADQGHQPPSAFSVLVRYPAGRWLRAAKRIARGRRRWLPGFLLLTPLVLPGLGAAAAGSWLEWRSLPPRRRSLR